MPDLFAEGEQYITRADKPHLRVRLVPGRKPMFDDYNPTIVQLQIRTSFLTKQQKEVYERAQAAVEAMLFIGAMFDADWIDVMLARYECSDPFEVLAKAATLLLYEGFEPPTEDDNA